MLAAKGIRKLAILVCVGMCYGDRYDYKFVVYVLLICVFSSKGYGTVGLISFQNKNPLTHLNHFIFHNGIKTHDTIVLSKIRHHFYTRV
jgi:hypothetical protein